MTTPRYRRSAFAMYFEASPFRPLSWRWDLGHHLLAEDILPYGRVYDVYVQVAWHAARVKANSEPVPIQLIPVFELKKIYDDNGPQRWELEARTLARDDVSVIADKCSMESRMVLGYQHL